MSMVIHADDPNLVLTTGQCIGRISQHTVILGKQGTPSWGDGPVDVISYIVTYKTVVIRAYLHGLCCMVKVAAFSCRDGFRKAPTTVL